MLTTIPRIKAESLEESRHVHAELAKATPTVYRFQPPHPYPPPPPTLIDVEHHEKEICTGSFCYFFNLTLTLPAEFPALSAKEVSGEEGSLHTWRGQPNNVIRGGWGREKDNSIEE